MSAVLLVLQVDYFFLISVFLLEDFAEFGASDLLLLRILRSLMMVPFFDFFGCFVDYSVQSLNIKFVMNS